MSPPVTVTTITIRWQGDPAALDAVLSACRRAMARAGIVQEIADAR